MRAYNVRGESRLLLSWSAVADGGLVWLTKYQPVPNKICFVFKSHLCIDVYQQVLFTSGI